MIPTPYTLRVRSKVDGDPDEFGNVTSTWVERDWLVHGYVEGPATTEQLGSNRDLSVVSYTVLAPAGSGVGEYDEVRVAGEWYAVNARPADYSHGPWEFPDAGVVVELRAANG